MSGGIVATILNLILPQEGVPSEEEDSEEVDIEDAKDAHDEGVKTD